MSRPLDGIQAKLEIAKVNMHRFHQAYQATLKANPIRFTIEPDTGSSDYLVKIESAPDLPPILSAIVGDVLHDFRSALDHLVWQLALTQTPKPSRSTMFPIAENERDFKTRCFRIADLAPEHQAMIEGFQPYHRGSQVRNPLRDLARLINRDKHQELNPMMIRTLWHAPDFEGVNCTIDDVMFLGGTEELTVGTKLARLKISNAPAGEEPYVKVKGYLIPEEAFRGGDIVPTTYLLIGSEVLRIVQEFETVLEPRPRPFMTRSPRRWPTFSAWPPTFEEGIPPEFGSLVTGD